MNKIKNWIQEMKYSLNKGVITLPRLGNIRTIMNIRKRIINNSQINMKNTINKVNKVVIYRYPAMPEEVAKLMVLQIIVREERVIKIN